VTVVVDGETQLDDDTQPSDTQSDDDQTASVAYSDATSASDPALTWSDRACNCSASTLFLYWQSWKDYDVIRDAILTCAQKPT